MGKHIPFLRGTCSIRIAFVFRYENLIKSPTLGKVCEIHLERTRVRIYEWHFEFVESVKKIPICSRTSWYFTRIFRGLIIIPVVKIWTLCICTFGGATEKWEGDSSHVQLQVRRKWDFTRYLREIMYNINAIIIITHRSVTHRIFVKYYLLIHLYRCR